MRGQCRGCLPASAAVRFTPVQPRQEHYDAAALRRLRADFHAGVVVRELTESEARRACFAALIPVFFPTQAQQTKDYP